MTDSGATDLAELVLLIARYDFVDVRLALVRVEDRWQVLNGEVVLDAAVPATDRVWRYAEEIFLQRRLPSRVVAALILGELQDLSGIIVSAPPSPPNGIFHRVPGQRDWSGSVMPWPRIQWDVSRSDTVTSRHSRLLVGDGPGFVSFEAAFAAFFHGAAPSNHASQHPLWRVIRLDRRGWLHRITIAPDALTVVTKGTKLAGVTLELSTPTSRLIRKVGKTGRLRLPLNTGLADNSLLMLRTDDDWLDYRYFTASTPGRERDASIVWAFPGADLEVLVAGGEGPTTEFKQEIPITSESRRNVLKTIAAFASGDGGTLLFGVDDNAQVVGINPSTVDGQKLTVGNMIRSSIEPDPPCTMRVAEMHGKTLLLVEVRAGGRWHAHNPAKPEFYIRRGASTVPARLDEIGAGFGYQPSGSIPQPW